MLDASLLQRMNVASRGSATGSLEGNVAAESSLASASWISALGYDEVAVGLRSDGAHDWSVDLLWSYDPSHAGGEVHGESVDVVAGSATSYGCGRTAVKAPYFKLKVNNGDAAPHAMKCWYMLVV